MFGVLCVYVFCCVIRSLFVWLRLCLFVGFCLVVCVLGMYVGLRACVARCAFACRCVCLNCSDVLCVGVRVCGCGCVLSVCLFI